MGREKTAFIGFTYNGKHSIDDFGVYRTSDGNRYNHNLIPQLNDKTADVPGGHGQYYFNSTYKTRQFSIPIAFDHLEEEKFFEMRRWLNGTEIHELIFDEMNTNSFVVRYSAKVTGTPQLKFVCFEEEYEITIGSGENTITETKKKNIYKGEGTIQFTCYFPFGYSLNQIWLENQDNQTKNKSWNSFSFYGEYPTSFVLTLENYTGGTLTISSKKDPKEFEDLSITIPTTTAGKLTWDSATGLVKINDELISYSGRGYGTVLGEVLISITNMPALETATIDYKALTY